MLIGLALAAATLLTLTLLSNVLLLVLSGVLVGVALHGSARWLRVRLG